MFKYRSIHLDFIGVPGGASTAEINAADVYYRGGYRHEVTAAEADALTAAGYVVTSEATS